MTWATGPLDSIAEINPARALARGEEAPFLEMAAVGEWERLPKAFGAKPFSGGCRFQDGDALLARITPCLENGKAAQVEGLGEGVVAHGSTEFLVLAARPGRGDGSFIYYLTRDPAFRAYAIRHMNGSSGRQRVSAESVRGYEFPIPPLDEQIRIGAFLRLIDHKIESNRRTARRCEGLLGALWTDLASDATRTVPLDAYAEINPKRTLVSKGPAAYLPMASMPTVGYRPMEMRRREPGSGARFTNGDVLVARITPCLENGKIAFIDGLREHEVGWGSTEYVVLHARPGVPAFLPYLIVRAPEFIAHATRNMNGSSGRQRCPSSAMAAFEVPSIEATRLSALESEFEPVLKLTRSLHAEADRLSHLRNELLPRLLTGAQRIEDGRAT